MYVKFGPHIYIYIYMSQRESYIYITIIPVHYTCNNVTNYKYGVVANFVVISDNIMIMQSELYPFLYNKIKLY